MFCTPTQAPGRAVVRAARAVGHSAQDSDPSRGNERMKTHLGGRCGI